MTVYAQHQPLPSLLHECAAFVRRSRSLASMLPALVASGLVTLAYAWIAHPLRGTDSDSFLQVLLESWLTAWPIAFPIAYVLGSALLKAIAWIGAKATAKARRPVRRLHGLSCSDVSAVSARVTANHGCTVLRHLKPAHDYRA